MPTNPWGRAYTRPSALSCLLILSAFLIPKLVTAQTIFIGEVNWAGSEASIADEWVELWNIGMDPQPLVGWTLEGATAKRLSFNDDHAIAPQGTFLIANYAEDDKRSVLATEPALTTTDLSLSNNELHLVLRDGSDQIIDEIGTGNKPPAGSTIPPSSMVRELANTTGTTEGWKTSSDRLNLDPNAVSQGTPNMCDGCEHESATSSTTSEYLSSTSTAFEMHATSTFVDIPSSEATSSFSVDTPTSTFSTSSSTIVVDELSTSSTLSETTSTFPFLAPTSSTLQTTTSSTEFKISASTTEVTIATTNATPSTNIPPQNETPPPICAWHFTHIFPAPSEGPEWVEVSGCPSRETLNNWSIHDPVGHILTIQADTSLTSIDDERLRIPLPGQHLRNTGDTVILRGPEGSIYDIVAYPSHKSNEHYQKGTDGTWQIPERLTQEPPASAIPSLPIPSTAISVTTIPPIPSLPAIKSATAPTNSRATEATPVPKTSPPVLSLSYEEYKTHLIPPQKPSATKLLKASTQKTSTRNTKKKASSMPTPQPPRIRVEGTVGTPPGLIGKQRFVLLNSAGKGLLIHTSNTQASPPLGASIELSGTLIRNDNGPYIKMASTDRWQQKSQPLPTPEAQSLEPEQSPTETAWSLVELTARVKDSKQASATLLMNDIEVELVIPRSLNYRAQRLKKGDLVHVTGVVDTAREPHRLYPREASEIVLMEAAKTPVPTSTSQNHSLPPWIPMGAASTTIAGGYGWKRFQKWREQKRLEDQLEEAMQALSSSS